MVLGFKRQFEEPIIKGDKIHTIRLDKGNRWKEGNPIQFATGVRAPNYNEFKTGVCFGTQEIEIKWKQGNASILIDGKPLSHLLWNTLAMNDGFDDANSFLEWDAWHKVDFIGKIIHWTEKKY
jgi:hypothetical protein